jgi:hypothetical protein
MWRGTSLLLRIEADDLEYAYRKAETMVLRMQGGARCEILMLTRQQIFVDINGEREYQNNRWGNDFDSKNTPNDWVAYISKYLGQAVTMPFNEDTFRTQLLKVATLAVAALEQEKYAPRHYDNA